jgi:PAS domain S-box-containing protein
MNDVHPRLKFPIHLPLYPSVASSPTSGEFRTALEEILNIVNDAFKFDGAIIYVADHPNRYLRCAAFTGRRPAGQKMQDFGYGFDERAAATWVLHNRQSFYSASPSDPRINPKGVRAFRIRGPIVGVPLLAATTCVGCLVVWSKQGNDPTPEAANRLEPFARLAGSRIALWESEQIRSAAEQALKASEAFFRSLVETIPANVFRKNANGDFTFVNSQFEQTLKRLNPQISKVIGSNDFDYYPRELAEKYRHDDHEVLNSNRNFHSIERTHLKSGGKEQYAEVFKVPVVVNGEKQLQGIFWDVTHRVLAEKSLRISERRYRGLFQYANDIIYTHDGNGRFTSLNAAGRHTLGYSHKDFATTTIRDIVLPEYLPLVERMLRKQGKGLGGKTSGRYEIVVLSKAGQNVHLETNARLVQRTGRIYEIEGIARDVTERKRKEEHIEALLKEKITLLRETHHRVRTNLEIAASLFHLQARSKKGRPIRKLLQECELRLNTLSEIHRELYQTSDSMVYSVQQYFVRLAERIVHSLAAHPERITLDLRIEDVHLPADAAIPCALIINELVTNSVKYAFRKKRRGVIAIRFFSSGDKYQLEISDDGVGLPASVELGKAKSLGLTLVHTLATQQLDGHIEVIRTPGVFYRITFEPCQTYTLY